MARSVKTNNENLASSPKARQSGRRRINTKVRQKRQRIRSIISRLLFISASIGLIVGIIFLLFGKQFQLRSLAISSSDQGLSERVTDIFNEHLEKKTYLIPNTSQFLWTKSLVKRLLTTEMAGINDFDISINDNELLVSIDEAEPVARWCPNGINLNISLVKSGCLGINLDGEAFLYQDMNDRDFWQAPAEVNTVRVKSVDRDKLDPKVTILNQKKRLYNLITFTDYKVIPARPGETIVSDLELETFIQLSVSLQEFDYQISNISLSPTTATIPIKMLKDEVESEGLIRSIILPISDLGSLQYSIQDLLLLLQSKELQAVADREDIAYFKEVDFSLRNKVFYSFVKIEDE